MAESPRSRCQQVTSSEASLLGLQMAAFLLPLHMVGPLCTHIPAAFLCVQIPSFYKDDASQIGLGPTLKASF